MLIKGSDEVVALFTAIKSPNIQHMAADPKLILKKLDTLYSMIYKIGAQQSPQYNLDFWKTINQRRVNHWQRKKVLFVFLLILPIILPINFVEVPA